MDDTISSAALLASVAQPISKPFLAVGVQLPSAVAGQIGTRLHVISQSLEQSYATDAINDAAGDLLVSLLNLFTSSSGMPKPQEAHSWLSGLLHIGDGALLERMITILLEHRTPAVKSLNDQCGVLYARLQTRQDSSPGELPDGVQSSDSDDHPMHINKRLFEALQLHTACVPQSHREPPLALLPESARDPPWHPTRLFLAGSAETHKKRAIFNIVVSSVDMSSWQEFCLGVSMRTRSGQRKARFMLEGVDNGETEEEEEEEDASESSLPLAPGDLCTLIDQKISARIRLHLEPNGLNQLHDSDAMEHLLYRGEGVSLSEVVEKYKLTAKDKVSLAHALAHSCWQFYASDLMAQRWTGNRIWFMPEEADGCPVDKLPLKAYASLDFSRLGHDMPELLDEAHLSHRLPRILALGIMLLEVGLGRSFRPKACEDLIRQINTDHGTAKRLLHELETTEWAGFKRKDVFTKVIESCLDYKNFLEPWEARPKQQKAKSLSASTQVQAKWAEIAETRKRQLYRKVVWPLSWLVKKGFRAGDGRVSYIARRSLHDEAGRPEEPEAQMALFHGGMAVVPSMWLDNLKHIAAHTERLQREHRDANIQPVKVAILDTGYHPGFPFFQDPQRAGHIKGWRDFVTGSVQESNKRVDSFGHGSFMTRLLMESSPLADIYVARVAENTTRLSSNAGNVAKAILWAGLEEDVDIISMSFGFSQDDLAISDAIRAVCSKRHAVIFLASAGNDSAYQAETFPARHPDVISIHATNCHGEFLASNPSIDYVGSAVLGTFGDDVPNTIRDEIQGHFARGNVCQPGTSVATAIAAGIVANILAYAAVLPVHLAIDSHAKVFRRLKTAQGMTRMLEMMAPPSASLRQRFINPIWFYSDRSTDWARGSALHDCMWKVKTADI